jgi:type II secretory pathway component PulF
MPTYKYRARRGPEDIVDDYIEARSGKEAIEKLSLMGYLPIRIEESRAIAKLSLWPSNSPSGRIKSHQITIFSRQLASLLKSGVPILKALNIISEQSENIRLKIVLNNIYSEIKDGVPFSSSLAKYPKVFSPIYIAMVYTGENSGDLPGALLRITDYRMKQEEMFSRFRMALAYPLFMAIVGLATVIFMLGFVVPRLMHIFVNMGQVLPLPTRILISLSSGLRQGWFWIVLILALVIFTLKRRAKTERGKLSLSLFKLRLPILGKFLLKAELSRFCRTLELLIRNGVPILKAINVAIPVLENELIKKQLEHSYKELEQGSSFGGSLKNSKLFPLFFSNLIIVGEESGKLDEALAEVSSSYERDTDEAIKIMSNLLEPIMILVMGLIVGFIVAAMLLPIFEINIMAR